jgi:phospholipase C
MSRSLRFALVAPLVCLAPLAACSSSSSPNNPGNDAGTQADSAMPPDAATVACAGPCPASSIKYVVVIVMENMTFDNHFGAYCTAAAGSAPTCNTGPACCEGAPAKDPSGASPVVLDDTEHGKYLPQNSAICLADKIDAGKMDHYVAGGSCPNPENFVQSSPAIVKPYWDLAKQNAIADRYFQPLVSASSGNNMFFARAGYVLTDNPEPTGAVGNSCGVPTPKEPAHTEKNIADLLTTATVPLTFYAEGYDAQATAFKAGSCATADPGCAAAQDSYPCEFDPGDDPFQYYDSTRDKPAYIKDLSKLSADLSGKTLPAVSFVKPLGFKTEHPGFGDLLSAGPTFVTQIISQVQASPYAASTLVLVTWDEGGGYFDHVAPPAANTADNKPYGPRVPLIAVGPMVKKNYVSHVQMEHSSIVKFIEWNWLGMTTGQLMTRDANVANLGDLLDPALTGVTVPAN